MRLSSFMLGISLVGICLAVARFHPELSLVLAACLVPAFVRSTLACQLHPGHPRQARPPSPSLLGELWILLTSCWVVLLIEVCTLGTFFVIFFWSAVGAFALHKYVDPKWPEAVWMTLIGGGTLGVAAAIAVGYYLTVRLWPLGSRS